MSVDRAIPMDAVVMSECRIRDLFPMLQRQCEALTKPLLDGSRPRCLLRARQECLGCHVQLCNIQAKCHAKRRVAKVKQP